MALALLSSGISLACGSAGTVTAHHRQGRHTLQFRFPIYARSFPLPTYRIRIRGLAKTLANNWQALPDGNLSAWIAYAKTVPQYTDCLGNSAALNGWQAFLQANLPLLQAGLPPLLSPPTYAPAPAVTQAAITITANPPEATLSGIQPTPTTSQVVRIHVSKPLSPGTFSIHQSTPLLYVTPLGGEPQSNFTAQILQRYGAIITGAKYAVAVDILDASTGQIGQKLIQLITAS
jgi:hypothetical protein